MKSDSQCISNNCQSPFPFSGISPLGSAGSSVGSIPAAQTELLLSSDQGLKGATKAFGPLLDLPSALGWNTGTPLQQAVAASLQMSVSGDEASSCLMPLTGGWLFSSQMLLFLPLGIPSGLLLVLLALLGALRGGFLGSAVDLGFLEDTAVG